MADFSGHSHEPTIEYRLTRIEKRLDDLEAEHIAEEVAVLQTKVDVLGSSISALRTLVSWMIATGVLLLIGMFSSLTVVLVTHLFE